MIKGCNYEFVSRAMASYSLSQDPLLPHGEPCKLPGFPRLVQWFWDRPLDDSTDRPCRTEAGRGRDARRTAVQPFRSTFFFQAGGVAFGVGVGPGRRGSVFGRVFGVLCACCACRISDLESSLGEPESVGLRA